MVGGRYRLVSLVAVDADGDLFWRAKDTVLPRDMAVTLLPEGPNTNATVTRTLRAGRLHHIGLPQTLDLGNETDHAYVVSQWVDGATLTDLLAGGPLSGEVASGITAKVADAVAEAHRNGIALGALHPSLVRVNFDGQVRLSHVISYPGATEEQDIRAVGGLLYLMLTGTFPLPQSGMSPPLPIAPTRGGHELPADEANPSAAAALAALAERTLHPDGTHGVRSASAISALLADVETEQPALVGGDDAAGARPPPGRREPDPEGAPGQARHRRRDAARAHRAAGHRDRQRDHPHRRLGPGPGDHLRPAHRRAHHHARSDRWRRRGRAARTPRTPARPPRGRPWSRRPSRSPPARSTTRRAKAARTTPATSTVPSTTTPAPPGRPTTTSSSSARPG